MGNMTAATKVAGRPWIIAGIFLWAAFVVASMGWLTAYGYIAGAQHAPPRLNQISSPVTSDGAHYGLVIAIHPKCPCSRASMGELERLLARFRENLECTVLVYRPRNADDTWMDTDTVDSAKRQPHTRVVTDLEGNYARQLGISTSGGVILYSPQGLPEYWGGITPSRGHYGDNIGSDAISAVLSGSRPLRRSAPVYGCQIIDETCSRDAG